MAVRIRLMRMGAKKKPHYRIVAADARAARDGRFIELLGYYDPKKNPPDVKVDKEKVMKWLKNGAQVTDTVKTILKKQNLDPDEFRKALKKKR
ncbi:MAG TPA: 30S ribosomal protein S16 [Candidatus Omnitrophica bacterium]|nr:30S ribosomal protein S16 [Candidatus Omnitrophota bacterium]